MPAHLKDPAVRRRRNKATTRLVLSEEHQVEEPPLPASIAWHPLTQQWWSDLWASPMATEYLNVDINGLYRVAVLTNDFWTATTPRQRILAQVRLEKADSEFGTNPLARRRLEWQIEATEDSKRRGRRHRADEVAAPPAPTDDPRLRLVKGKS